MKRISLGVLAILFASATLFVSGPVAKAVAKKAKQDCHNCPPGKCMKDGKIVNCPDPESCPDKANCHEMTACPGKCS
jgi:hypothetical protein